MALGLNIKINNEEEKNLTAGERVKDLLLAVPRGVEGAAQGIYNLTDTITFDALPDYDNRFLGRSETLLGGLGEGVTQFLVPFGGIAKGATMLSKAGKLGRVGKQFTKTNKKGKEVLNWKGVLAAESASDFVAFEGHEERLSNLIQTFPALRNPITEFLQAKEGDNEILGRFKNSIEGLGLTGMVTGLVAGLKAIKTHRANKNGGEYVRKNAAAFQQLRTFGEVDTYDVYSPTLKAAERLPKFIRPEKIEEELVKLGERGTAEELKWIGFDFSKLKDAKDLTGASLVKDSKGRIDSSIVQKILGNRQLETVLVEQKPNPTWQQFRQPKPDAPEGSNYREFTLEASFNTKTLLQREDLGDFHSHFEKVANDKNRTNILHFRTTDRVVGNKRVLQVEELQSDFIQAVKKKRKTDKQAVKGKVALEDSYIGSSMRQIVQLAAKEGYDAVSFPKGQDIAGLYETTLDKIKLRSIAEDGSRSFDITRNNRTQTVVVKTDKELKDTFGKQAGEDLKTKSAGWEAEKYQVNVNSSPFKLQYNEKMPSALDRFAKAFGTSTRSETLNFSREFETTELDADYLVDVLSSGTKNDQGRYSIENESVDNIISTLDMKNVSIRDKQLNRELNASEFQETLEEVLTSRYDLDADDAFYSDRLSDALEDFVNTGGLKQNYEVLVNDGRGTLKQEASIIDINDAMKDSVNNGVSLWGQRGVAKNTYGTNIPDAELRTALGLNEAETYNIVKAMAKEARADKGEVVETVNGKEATTEFALTRLAENGSSKEVRNLAKTLLKLHEGDEEFMKTGIETRFGSDAAGDYNPFDPTTGRGSIGLYTNRTKVFNGDVDPDAVFSEGTLLHEMIHAGVATKIPVELSAVNRNLKGEDYVATVAAYADDSAQPEPLRKILKSYLKAVESAPDKFKSIRNSINDIDDFGKANSDSISEWYGLSNVDEFIAEAMSNPTFQGFLKGIEGTGGKNLFDELISYLKDLIGVGAKGTLLEDVVRSYSDLATKHKKRYRAIDYSVENARRMFPTRSSHSFRQKHEQKRKELIDDAFSEAAVDLGAIKRGGEAAVKGVARSLNQVETANDLGELIAKTEKLVETELTADPKIKADQLEAGGIAAAVDRFSELTGTNKDFIMSEVNAAAKDAKELRKIAARMYTVESLALGQSDVVYKLADDLNKKGTAITEIDKAQFVGEIKKLVNISAAGSNLRRGFGQGLRSTQFQRSKLTLNEIEIRNQSLVNEFMANNLKEQNFNVLLNRILAAGEPEDAIQTMMGVTRQGKQIDPDGFMEKAQNWYINSLLSGPRTFVKNAVGNMVAQTLLQVETAVGGIFVNPAITRQVMKEFATLESFREGMRFFLKAYSMDEQLLDVGRSPLENSTKTSRASKYFPDAHPDQQMRNAFNWFGENIVQIPTKLLLSMDEVFKQSLFRQNAKLELTLKGMKIGIKDPDELSDYVARGLETVLVQGERAFSNTGIIRYANDAVNKLDEARLEKGESRLLPSERAAKVKQIIDEETAKRGDALKKYEDGGLGFDNLEEIDKLSADSLEYARYGTFTNDAGKSAELAGAIIKSLPFMKFIFPFVRTPINLLKFSFDRAFFAGPELTRTALANMPDMPMVRQTQARLRKQLESRSPVERARAKGKLATSAMINTTLLYMILSNRDFITSGGPKDPAQLRTLEQTGWQRYSFRIGDKYFSYSGLDPFGTHFGVLADIVDQFDDANREINSTLAEQVFAAATISLTRNVTDKSYLAGLQMITDALSDPERKMEKMVNNLAGGFVPNILYQGQSVGGDTTTREVRNLGDAILKKLPNGNDILDPKRNLLGEPIVTENIPFVGPFNPSRISSVKNDDVFTELAQLEHGFSNPRSKIHRLIDLTDYKTENNQSAYDRQLEVLGTVKINGRTLRQSLERLIASANYQKLSTISEGGVKSPRIQLINRVLSKYRKVAFSQMLREFPEVKDKFIQLKQAQIASRSGASDDVVSNLLNINE